MSDVLRWEDVLYVEGMLSSSVKGVIQLLTSPFQAFYTMKHLTAFFFLLGTINYFLVLRLRKKGSFQDCVMFLKIL